MASAIKEEPVEEITLEIVEKPITRSYRNVNLLSGARKKEAILKVVMTARRTKDEWVRDFLRTKSKNTRTTYANYIKQFFVNFPDIHPLDLSMLEIKNVLTNVILSKKGITYKQGFLSAIRGLFEGMVYDFNMDLQAFGVPNSYYLPLPIPPTSRLPPIKDDANKICYSKVLCPIEIGQILRIIRSNAPKDIELCLIIIIKTACRQSEARSILIDNVHLEGPNPYIITGVVEGCMKSNPKGNPNRKLYYPIDKKLAFQLGKWIEKLRSANPSEKWLFPANSEVGFMEQTTLNAFLRENVRPQLKNPEARDHKKGLTCHWFRHSMINNRRTIMGCDFLTSQILQYHVTNNVEIDIYTHFSLEERIKIWWDKYPYKDID